MTLMVVEAAASLVPLLVISTFVASASPGVVPLGRSLLREDTRRVGKLAPSRGLVVHAFYPPFLFSSVFQVARRVAEPIRRLGNARPEDLANLTR